MKLKDLKQYKMDGYKRLFFLFSSCVLFFGIYLTGWKEVHWLLYIPPIFFLGASLNGYCTGLIISQMLFDKLRKDEK